MIKVDKVFLKEFVESLLVERDPKSNTDKKTDQALDKIAKILLKSDYQIEERTENTLIIRAEDRNFSLKDIIQKLKPFGWVHEPIARLSSLGRLVWPPSKSGLKRNLYIGFKDFKGSSGSNAAELGRGYENELADSIEEKYKKFGIEVATGGFGSGVDLMIQSDKSPIKLKIEVKTQTGSDFGQFGIAYNLESRQWLPKQNAHFMIYKEVFQDAFDNVVASYMNKNAFFPPKTDKAVLRKKGNIITGLTANLEAENSVEMLQRLWFHGKSDIYLPYDFKKISKYYLLKGSEFIQIKNFGLFGLSPEKSSAFNIPFFGDAGLRSYIRIRIKSHGGSDRDFNCGVKIRGQLIKSAIDLDTPEGQEKIIQKLLTSIKENSGDFEWAPGSLPPQGEHYPLDPKKGGLRLAASYVDARSNDVGNKIMENDMDFDYKPSDTPSATHQDKDEDPFYKTILNFFMGNAK